MNDEPTTPKLTLQALADALKLSLTQVQRLKAKGMDCSSVEAATNWRTSHLRAPRDPNTASRATYPTAPVEGDDADSRFNRLVESETYISQQIAGLQEITIPDLVSKLASGRAVERLLFQANGQLVGLRKEHRNVCKQIADLEFKRQVLHGGMVKKEVVLDALNASFTCAFAELRNWSKTQDEALRPWLDHVADKVVTHFRDALVDFTSRLSSPQEAA